LKFKKIIEVARLFAPGTHLFFLVISSQSYRGYRSSSTPNPSSSAYRINSVTKHLE